MCETFFVRTAPSRFLFLLNILSINSFERRIFMSTRIFVDQGHNPSGFNTGVNAFGLKEQDITYLIGAYLAEIAKTDPQLEIAVSRRSPNEILGFNEKSDLRERTNMAEKWKADYCLCIHVGIHDDPDTNGSEAYVLEENTKAFALSEIILSEIAETVGTQNNHTHKHVTPAILKKTKIPVVYINLAYISNYEDSVLLGNAPYQFAHAIYSGLKKYVTGSIE